MAGRDSPNSPSSSPNKRLKILSPSPHSNCEVESSSNRHEAMADSISICCGICLSDGGRATRGHIDCCDHYFCFVCIMEWAKVESRCPMCKRRFSTIRRFPKDGVFPCERVVDVPVRDQAFHHLGNITVGPSDPYGEVQCSVCHGQEDENFLLLCDLCNCASHTYCIGLGRTVPEGDWFCHDCAVSRDEHAEMDSSCDAFVSAFDLVQESNGPKIERSSVSVTSQSQRNLQSSSIVPDTGSLGCQVNEPNARAPRSVVDKMTESDVRTLRRCRNVHSRIRELRNNWEGLRSGSLSFSSSAVYSSGSHGQRDNISSVLRDRSGQPCSSSSTSCRQLTTQDSNSSCSLPRGGSDDINKAWKMMSIAKSMLQTQERVNRVHQASEVSLLKRRVSNEPTGSDSSHFTSRNQQSARISNQGNTGIERQYKCSYGKQIDKFKSPSLDMQKKNRFPMKGTVKSSDGHQSTCLPRDFESSSSATVQTGIQNAENRLKLVQKSVSQASVKKDVKGALSTVSNEPHGSASLMSLVSSESGASDSYCAKPRPVISSSCNPKGKSGLEKSQAEGKARKDDAKTEIQSLVKLNLKLLSSGQHLGVDAFKEIARLSTHTILAACGLEHRKSGSRSLPPPVCHHIENNTPQISKSSLMPNSCRECFFAFVKDVVNSIMLERK